MDAPRLATPYLKEPTDPTAAISTHPWDVSCLHAPTKALKNEIAVL